MNFNGKAFNEKAFMYIAERIPNTKRNELIKSKVLKSNPDIKNVFSSQNGTSYAQIAMRGLLDGTAVNYDGVTDIEATSTKTFTQGVVVIGRGKAWEEQDFSYDITGGVDFMVNIVQQIVEYWEDIDQNTLLSIIKGIFAMTGEKNEEFIEYHTYDITSADDGFVTATTLNSATQLASGDNKKKFTCVIMHSTIATNLENLQLITYLKQTDKDGIQRDLGLGTWNGKLVIIDDSMPSELLENGKTQYETYVLGDGAFSFEDIGVKVPMEEFRDPKTRGGVDILYNRQRKVLAPFGISYTKANQATDSPTAAELENGLNWSLVHSGEYEETERSYISHKAIPICRIISLG